ncbi:Phosphorylated carbohydrates phosphatase [Hordeum vulgare]|nr:Phosphorylated carbohydrates phosphatase [Hordeum vulgare]
MPVPDTEERLLQWVYRRSLTMTDTDAQWLQRINFEQLWLDIEQSEREAAEATSEAARVAKLKRNQDRLPRLHRHLLSPSSDGSDSDGSDVDGFGEAT